MKYIIGIIFWLSVTACYAVEDIMILGLFKDKVALKIDGKQRFLKLGKQSPEGVKLISASSRYAILEVDGKRAKYKLGTKIKTNYRKAASREAHVFRGATGMYRVIGSINGFSVSFLIDTGATVVSMNGNEAKRLGLDYKLWGKRTFASTASSITEAYSMKLKKVKVGEIELYNIDCLIIDGDFPQEVLLGNSFLGKLEIKRTGNKMVLKKIY